VRGHRGEEPGVFLVRSATGGEPLAFDRTAVKALGSRPREIVGAGGYRQNFLTRHGRGWV